MYHRSVRSWSVLCLVAVGCYRPTDSAHCAITCDPFSNNCPGELVCGTDSFCHGPGEAIDVCVPGLVDAMRGPDAPIIRLDAGPDAGPDGGISCVHEWAADFSSDPTTSVSVDRWQRVGGGAFPVGELQPAGAPTFWAAQSGDELITNGSSAFATATEVDVTLHVLDQTAGIQLNVNGTNGKSTQLVVTVTHVGVMESITLENRALPLAQNPLITASVSDDFHRIRLVVKPNGGLIVFAVDATTVYTSPTYATATASIMGGVTLYAAGNTQFDNADVCAQ